MKSLEIQIQRYPTLPLNMFSIIGIQFSAAQEKETSTIISLMYVNKE